MTGGSRPASPAPAVVGRRGAGCWGVAVLARDGTELALLAPTAARAMAAELVDMAAIVDQGPQL